MSQPMFVNSWMHSFWKFIAQHPFSISNQIFKIHHWPSLKIKLGWWWFSTNCPLILSTFFMLSCVWFSSDNTRGISESMETLMFGLWEVETSEISKTKKTFLDDQISVQGGYKTQTRHACEKLSKHILSKDIQTSTQKRNSLSCGISTGRGVKLNYPPLYGNSEHPPFYILILE